MFENLTLQEVCNFIILISAVIIAGKNIYGFFKKPVIDLQDKTKSAEVKRIQKVIADEVPQYINEYAQKEAQTLVDSLKSSVTQIVEEKIGELKQLALDTKQSLQQVQKSVDLMNDSQMDIMRLTMNQIYYKYRPYKKILDCDKKAFIKIYTDYHQMGGNTWIDALYQEVVDWEIVEDEAELVKS